MDNFTVSDGILLFQKENVCTQISSLQYPGLLWQYVLFETKKKLAFFHFLGGVLWTFWQRPDNFNNLLPSIKTMAKQALTKLKVWFCPATCAPLLQWLNNILGKTAFFEF